MVDKMTEESEKMDGTNEHLQTKDDMRMNLDKVSMLTVVLKALSVGIEVKLDNRFIVMVDGKLYVKAFSFETKTQTSSTRYLGYSSNLTFDNLLDIISKKVEADPEWLVKIKAETAMTIVLNNLDKKSWLGVGD